jgi:hypothetical protein
MSVSSLVFEKNIGEDRLSSLLTQKVNIDDPYCIASLPPNQKLLNCLKLSTETLEMLNDMRVQLSTKHTLFANNHQGKIINTNIAEVHAKM